MISFQLILLVNGYCTDVHSFDFLEIPLLLGLSYMFPLLGRIEV